MTRYGFGRLLKEDGVWGTAYQVCVVSCEELGTCGSWSLEMKLEVDEVEYSCCVQSVEETSRNEVGWDLRLGLVRISNGSSPMQRQERVLDHNPC